jgi:Tfp pilus assembly protein PilW
MHRSPHRSAGFTLVELIVGVSLSMIVMAAVLASYVFVARSYTRTIGFGLPNQPTLEAQGRQTLVYFARDVQAASAVSTADANSPSSSEVTLTVPLSTGGTRNVTYYYNGTETAATAYGVTIPANTLARIDRDTSTPTPPPPLILHSSLLTCTFTYYDASGNPYTTLSSPNYLIGIKQISLVLTARAGTSANQTLTKVYTVASPRLLFRNKQLLP